MMNRKQFFDMHAHKWDSFVTKGLVKRIEKDIVPLFKIKKSDAILDVGSGTGSVAAVPEESRRQKS